MKSNYFIKFPANNISNIFLVALLLVVFSTSTYCSDNKTSKEDITSIRVGFWGPAEVSISGHKHDLKSGYTLGLNVDTPRENRYYTGFAFDIYRINPEETNESITLYNFGFVIKRDYSFKSSKLSFRPSITFGLALKPKLSFVGNSGHFTIKASVDIISNVDKAVPFLIEGGFFWAIAGMENRTKIYSFPAPLVRIGVMF